MSELDKVKWIIQIDNESNGYINIVDEKGYDICTVFGGFEKTKPNALLISKAPEMLEMLKDILDTNRSFWGEEESRAHQIYEVEKLIKEATEL